VECPTCKYPVPAEWQMCRRCGAPLHHELELKRVTIPANLARRRSASRSAARSAAPAGATHSDPAEAPGALRSSAPDTLLPGALPRLDSLLPRPPRSSGAPALTTVAALARKERRYLLVIAVTGVALMIGLLALWPVVFKSDTHPAASSTAQEEQARATSLLRTVVGGARTLFAPRRSFTEVSPAALRARSRDTPIVASATKARVGEVSIRVTSAAVLTLATPADAQRCVFARDEPEKTGTQFVTVRTAECRAASAPATGWSSR
jgi:hypothetical protein